MRRTNSIKVLLIALVISVGLSGALLASPQHKSSTKKKGYAKLAHQLRTKLNKVKQSRSQIRHELIKTEQKAAGAADQLSQVDSSLQDVSSQLQETQSSLLRHRARRDALKKSLVQTQFELSGQTANLRKRLRAMYEDGNQPLVSVLMGSASSGDLADRAYLIKKVATANSTTMKAYAAKAQQYEAEKAEQDRLVTSIASEAASEAAERDRLQSMEDEKQSILDGLESKKDSLQEMMNQMSRDEAAIQDEITAAERPEPSGSETVPSKFSGRLAWPCHGPITSPFGMRYHPILHKERMHTGIDIGVPYGTPIHAAAAGVVISAQYMNGYGNTVIIDHGGGIATVYGHNEKLLVHSGQHVSQGETIALAGATGLATGPHCHFEVRVHGHPVNPKNWL